MTNGGAAPSPFNVGAFLGVSGPQTLNATTRTDSSPGTYTVRFMGQPAAKLDNFRVTVVEFAQNMKTYDHVTVELDVTSCGYTSELPQPPDVWPGGLPLPPNLHVEFRDLQQQILQTVWFFVPVPCGSEHFSGSRTLAPAPHVRTGWLQEWAGTTMGMEGHFYLCP